MNINLCVSLRHVIAAFGHSNCHLIQIEGVTTLFVLSSKRGAKNHIFHSRKIKRKRIERVSNGQFLALLK